MPLQLLSLLRRVLLLFMLAVTIVEIRLGSTLVSLMVDHRGFL